MQMRQVIYPQQQLSCLLLQELLELMLQRPRPQPALQLLAYCQWQLSQKQTLPAVACFQTGAALSLPELI